MIFIIIAGELSRRFFNPIDIQGSTKKRTGLLMSTENLHVNDAREISCSASSCALSSLAAGINSRNLAHIAARRLGVCVILSVFVSCYLYGITTYGLVLGIVLGWLPSAFITWLAASGIGFMMRQRE